MSEGRIMKPMLNGRLLVRPLQDCRRIRLSKPATLSFFYPFLIKPICFRIRPKEGPVQYLFKYPGFFIPLYQTFQGNYRLF